MDPSGSEFFASAKEGTPNRKDERNRNLSNTIFISSSTIQFIQINGCGY